MPLGIAACIFGYTKATHLLTMKLGQERKSNLQRSLPTIMGTLQLYDPDTGELLMIVESVLATMYRTGAAAAVAAKHLSRPTPGYWPSWARVNSDVRWYGRSRPSGRSSGSM